MARTGQSIDTNVSNTKAPAAVIRTSRPIDITRSFNANSPQALAAHPAMTDTAQPITSAALKVALQRYPQRAEAIGCQLHRSSSRNLLEPATVRQENFH